MKRGKPDWRVTATVALLVAVPVVFNAVALTPELQPVPRINDEAWHYLFIQRVSSALSEGANPFDPWVSELECGFPYFTYYQHLPHLVVVALNRLLLGNISTIRILCIVRYLLLLGFPFTVYWSMRTMEFSQIAAATGAAFCSVIAAPNLRGFEYNSYVWYGWGLYTQLWAMHLLFISTACMQRLLTRGTGYGSVIFAYSVLFVSHLLYSGIAALMAIVLVVVDCSNAQLGTSRIRGLLSEAFRVAVAGTITALITAYFWLPFALGIKWIRLVRLEGFVSVGPSQTASAGDLTLHGQLLDYNRPAVLTVMAALGIIAALHSWRSVTSRISVALFFLSTFFYVLLPSWPVLNWLFLGHIFPPQRFVGPTQLAAILLIGIAGDWMWSMASALGLWRPFAVGATIVALMIPTLRERYAFYRADAQYIARFGKLEADSNWRDIIATLKAMPRGRTYLKVRARSVDGLSPLSRVLLYDDIETLQTAVSLSLNVALQLDFDDTNQAHYDVFNIRYVIAPRAFDVPAFLTLIKSNSSFALYRAETTGYAEFVKLRNVVILGSLTQAQKEMLRGQREWLSGSEPWRAVYPRWIVPAMALSAVAAPEQEFPPDASILDEKVRAGQFIFHAECHAPSNLVVKSAYNPNWHVTIDGIEQPTFAVAPNFLAVSVPAGRHEIVAEYRSTRVKKLLLILGVAVAVCTLVFCRRISAIERIWAFRYLSDPAGDRGTAGALRNKNSDLYR